MPATEISEFLGPCFILCCIAFVLFGVVCAQAFSYCRMYQDDPTVLRGTVWLSFVLEVLHTAMVLHFAYSYSIVSGAGPQDIDHVVWSTDAIIILGICIMFLTQGFYIWRVYQLSEGNVWATSIPSVSLMVRTGLAIVTAVLIEREGRWSLVQSSKLLHIMLTLSLSMNVATDMLLAVLFTYYLRRRKSAFQQTRNLVDVLILYAVSTGALAVVASLAVIVMFVAVKSLMFAGMYTLVGKVYANSMLAQLNMRKRHKSCSACGGIKQLCADDIKCVARKSDSEPRAGILVNVVRKPVPVFSPPASHSDSSLESVVAENKKVEGDALV